MGIILWPMIPFYFVPLSGKDVTGSLQSFDRACPTSVIADLYCFDYQTPTFGYNGVPLMLVVCTYMNAVPGIWIQTI